MTEAYNKPVPVVQQENEFYWEKCKAHELWLRKCNACTKTYFYPRDFCPNCHSQDVTWVQTDGKAKLYTFAIVARPPMPSFADITPFVTAFVEFDSGGIMATNLVGINQDPDPEKMKDQLKIGMDLEVVFEDISNEISLPKFKPAS
jgi:uncharacterized OB-fold protein